MIYVYDLLINLDENLIQFYEWQAVDNIRYLKKSIMFKVSNYIYKKIITDNIIVSDELLNIINNKSEIKESKNSILINYFCVFTNGTDTVGILFNEEGQIIKKTKFTLQDELELLEISNSLKTKKIDFKSISNKPYKYEFITRENKIKLNKINNEMEKLKSNEEIIVYLYYEWFNKKSDTYSYDELLKDINSSFSERHEKFLEILNIITINNV